MPQALDAQFQAMSAAFRAHPYAEAAERREMLERLVRALRTWRPKFTAAVNRDTGGRPEEETSLAEVLLAVNAARFAARRVAGWMRPRGRVLHWMLQPARAWIQPQPLGVVGIVTPWNYPILLSITPLVCALAAGNRAMLKLPEAAPEVSGAIAAMLEEIFPKI